MAITELTLGNPEDLILLKDDDVTAFIFTVTDADGAAFDFTGYTDVDFDIYRFNGDASQVNLTPTISSNEVTLTIDYSADITGTLNKGRYFYKLTYKDASNYIQTISYGYLIIT